MEHNEPKEYNQLFVGGDLSGIQKFLYNITSHKAAASLKGRSAFLTEYLKEVCKDIEMAIVDAGGCYDELYCSGGKFYLITQNTTAIVNAIDTCAKKIIEDLWVEHKGQLGLNIAHVSFNESNNEFRVEGHDDENRNSGVLWKYLNAEFARMKNQKFKDLLLTNYEQFFCVQGVTEYTKVCAVTGIELGKIKDYKEVSIGDGLFVLPSVKEQIEKGKDLNRKQGTLNKYGEPKTFEDYADGSNLGILRMDVDGLGKRFIIGFDTIAEYKEFSGKVKNFFEGKIGGNLDGYKGKKLLDTKDPNTGQPYGEYLNVIYAGGDDLFIVGRWDRLIDFAELIHKETEECFKNNWYMDEGKKRYISISGGIAIVKPKFPIAKAAEMAGEAEEASKQIDGKNAFNMFGTTIKWGDNAIKWKNKFNEEKEGSEFEKVKYYKNCFVEFVNDKNIEFNKSILHKLMLYSTLADINNVRLDEGKKPDYSYVWHASYYLTRFMEKYKNSEGNDQKGIRLNFCRNIRDNELGLTPGRNLKLIAVAARWAEQELKMNNN